MDNNIVYYKRTAVLSNAALNAQAQPHTRTCTQTHISQTYCFEMTKVSDIY